MATSFPTGLDAIQRVVASDLRNAPGKEGHVLHNNVCDAIEALQAKVGVDGSTDVTSLDNKVTTIDIRTADIVNLYEAGDGQVSLIGKNGYAIGFAGDNSPLTSIQAPAESIPTVLDEAFAGYDAVFTESGDARHRYFGARVMSHKVFGTQSWNTSAVAGDNPYAQYFLEFGTDRSYFKMRYHASNAWTTGYQMWVDGKRVWPELQNCTVGVRSLTFTFPDERVRTITMLLEGGHGHISWPYNCSLWKPTHPLGRRAMMVGDSWGAPDDKRAHGWPFRLGFALGYSDIHTSVEGGTGYVRSMAPRGNYLARTTSEIIPANPDDVFFVGSLNDIVGGGITADEVYDNAKACYTAIASALPKTRVFVTGPQWVTDAADATRDAFDAAIAAACAESPNVIACTSSKGWMVGTGKVGATVGSSFTNTNLLRASDGDHLVVPKGYEYWSQRLAGALRTISGYY